MRVLPLLAAVILLSAGASAQPVAHDYAMDDLLEPMLAGRDWKGLETLLSGPAPQTELACRLDWLQRRVEGGGNFFLAQLHARNLWQMGRRPEAIRSLLYAAALVRVDGAACADRSAPQRRLEQVLSWQAPILRAGRALPPNRKAEAVEAALALERKTAPRRNARDDILCLGGDDAQLAQMRRGSVTVEIIPLPGQPAVKGRPLDPPKDALPRASKAQFLPTQAVRAAQAAIRKSLPQSLAGILK
jgi:hypothetical protein